MPSMPREIGYKKGGRLYVEGVSVERIANAVGTPLFIYSKAAIHERLNRLKRAFGRQRPLICYALKANSNASVCRLLAREGVGADVVSGGELLRALRAGFKASNIVFSGVGKTEAELRLALKSKVRAINVESTEELNRISEIARSFKRPAPVVIRVNPDVDAGTHAHITTGRARDKFGVDAVTALQMYRQAQKDPRLEPVGVQCHIGSQITRVAPFRRAMKALARLLRDVEGLGIALKHVDIGGGMGIVYGKEPPFPVEELAKAAALELKNFKHLRLLLEPGRYLVGEAGILVTQVLYRKSADRRRFVIVDAAMTELVRPALYGAAHGVVAVRPTHAKARRLDIVGPVCETADTFVRGVWMAEPAQGDLLAFLQAGAYGFSMSSQYNSRPRCAEVLVSGSRCQIVRRRETFADLVRHDV